MTHRLPDGYEYIGSIDDTHFVNVWNQKIVSIDRDAEQPVHVYPLHDGLANVYEEVDGDLQFQLLIDADHGPFVGVFLCSITPNEPGIDVLELLYSNDDFLL